MKCNNCGTPLQGPTCTYCGLDISVPTLSLRLAIQDFLVSVVNYDNGLFNTFYRILTEPGIMLQEYLAGRRDNLTHPFSFAAFWIGFMALVSSQYFADGVISMEKSDKIISPFVVYFGEFLRSYSSYGWALIILCYAASSYFVYRQHTFWEHFYASSYLVGFGTLVSIMLYPLIGDWLLFLHPVPYLIVGIAFYYAYRNPADKWESRLKALAVTLFSIIGFWVVSCLVFTAMWHWEWIKVCDCVK